MEISVRNLTVRFGDNVAVDNLSIDIADGEMLVLLGPSGCGKTTTMRCLVGLQTADTGEITIGDDVVFDSARGINVPTNARNVGMVFQSYAIWPHMTVNQNVAFPLRMQKRGKAEIRERVQEALELVGLQGYGARGASNLSGGQMQRVALARSLVMRPRMLLLDEPLSNLDAKLREKLRYELRELQQSLGMTAIYVTHDQSEALALADRIAVMRDGVIEQLAAPVQLYRQPRTSFVADFLGVDNIFPAEVTAEDPAGGTALRLRDFPVEMSSAAAMPAGSPAFVCIRPEHVRLSAAPGPGPGNCLPATVVSSSFLGDRTRYHLRVQRGPSLYATVSEELDPLPPGNDVFACVPPDRVQLLAD